MSGGIVQLVATGAQDAWLTGKPDVSFFRSNYRKYTHFSSSIERQTIQGNPVAKGVSTIRIEKKGDLLSYVYLEVRDSTGAMIQPNGSIYGAATAIKQSANYFGGWAGVIHKVELLIGGQVVDTQDSTYSSLIEPITGAQTQSTCAQNPDYFYPLKFSFCSFLHTSLATS